MIKLIYLSLFFFTIVNSYSQDNSIEGNIEDLNKFLIKLDTLKEQSKYDSLIISSRKAYNFAILYNNEEAILKSLNLLALGLYSVDNTKESIDVLENYYHYAKKFDRVGEIIQHHYLLALNYQKEANYEQAFKWFFKNYNNSINYIKQGSRNKKLFYYCKIGLRQLAYTFVYSSQHKQGIQWYQNQLKIFSKTLPKEIIRCFYSDLSYIYSQGINYKLAVDYAQKALNISLKGKDKEDIFQDYSYLGIAYGNFNLTESNKNYLKALNYVKKGDAKTAWIFNDVSRNYNLMGRLKESVDYQFRCIDMHELNKDSIGLTFGFISLGVNMLNWRNFEDSEKYLLKATHYFKRKKLYLKLSETHSHLCDLYILTKSKLKLRKTLGILNANRKIVDVPRAHGLYYLCKAHYSLCVKKDFSKALKNGLKALTIFENANSPRKVTKCYNLIADAYYFKKDYAQAKKYYFKTLEIIDHFTHVYIKENVYRKLIKIFELLEDPANAYSYMKKLSKLEKVIFKRETMVNLLKKEEQYAQRKQILLTHNLEKKNSKLWEHLKSTKSILILSILFSILVFLIYLIKIRKHKFFRKNVEIEKQEINKKLEQSQEKVLKVSEELAEKEKALLHIRAEFEKASVKKDEANISDITKMISTGLLTENDWDHFFKIFNIVFPDLLKNLTNEYTNLTANDIKICTLIKLNLSNREMSEVLMVSYSSLMTARYRLRKKINLDKEEKLEEVINNV